mmetsp:Transcript_4549/g.6734  ORF Transcript_4549/g.6734 Transcript_4549/m.6734 type:complete len:223 (-) Transcript_4549:727-1395(-)|eukprot:CAMPEP_0172417894 /NCGR_PEP_ID=MMETSP1064-20121228/4382_1 /TAXON_ID=202472 /ORGANISM="Aulacoseira subarctica , Strain CCAP 1002/5" /LENGTH=222 /DNA_ID=CAMNT_0013156463 /DNA_START=269 /DNA_END=937 /DNA_ORIENTATION=+
MTFFTLKGAAAAMFLVTMASPLHVEGFRMNALANPNTRVAMNLKTFGSPLELIRDVDELLEKQLSSGLDDFYSYQPRLLTDRPFMENFRPRLLGSDMPSGVKLATPRYEITEGDSEFKVAVDVPGVKASDMKIHLEQDGRVLRLTGERKIQDGNWKSEMRFEKAFLLDKKIQSDKITANLSDGVVVITAPKVLSKEKKEDVEIPITEMNRVAVSEGKKEHGP